MTDKLREKIAEIVSIDNVNKTTLDERTQAIFALEVAGVPCETCAGTGKRIKMLDRHFTNRCPDCEGHGTIGMPLSELIGKAESGKLLIELLARFLCEEEYPAQWNEVAPGIQVTYQMQAEQLLDRLASGESR